MRKILIGIGMLIALSFVLMIYDARRMRNTYSAFKSVPVGASYRNLPFDQVSSRIKIKCRSRTFTMNFDSAEDFIKRYESVHKKCPEINIMFKGTYIPKGNFIDLHFDSEMNVTKIE